MPVWTARCRNQDPGCVSMGAIQRGTSWATIPKTLNRARTVHAPCAHRARTVRQRPLCMAYHTSSYVCMYGISHIIICMYIIRIISYVVSYSMSCYIFVEGIIAKRFLPALEYQCKYPPPPHVQPPPLSIPPPRGGNRHYLVPKKTCRRHISQDCATVTPGCLRLCPPPSFCPIAPLRPLKMFPQGTVVRYVRSTGEPVLATVQGPSPRGEQYRTITYKRGAAEVVHDRASLKRLTAVQTTSPPPRPAETPVQPAEVLPPKGVRQLQSTLHAFFQPRVQLPEDPEGTDAIPLAGNSPPRLVLGVCCPTWRQTSRKGLACCSEIFPSASIPVADGQHVQLFKTMWDRKRKFYTVPVQNKGHAQE